MIQISVHEMVNIFSLIGKAIECRLAKKQRQLSKARHSYGKNIFLDDCRGADLNADVADVVWDVLRREAVDSNFKPMLDDELLNVLGLADGDLDEVVLDIMNRCSCDIPSLNEVDDMSPVVTVADLISFVAQHVPSKRPKQSPEPQMQ